MSDAKTLSITGAEKPPVDANMVLHLLSIAKSTRALTGLKLAEMDFHNGQDELLLALDEARPISVSRLADELHVRPSTVSKMLDRLVVKGLVERSADNRDARRTVVGITPAGLDAKSLLLKLRGKLEAELISSYPGDLENMIQSLEVVAATLKTRLSRLR